MADNSPEIDAISPADEQVQIPKAELDAIHETMSRLETENWKASESLQNVEMMLDQKGWTPAFQYGGDGGLTLQQVKDASKQLRELVVGNPFVKRGHKLRATYVWGGGCEFANQQRNGKLSKLPSPIASVLEDDLRAQRYLFTGDAQEEMESSAYTDGHFFVLCDDSTKKPVQRLSLDQITADLRNPDNPEEIWAYRRQWSRNPGRETPQPGDVRVRWYYTDTFEGTRKKTIKYESKTETIETGFTVIDQSFNRQVGWAYGVPDALAIIAWAKLYKEFLVNGYIMSRALAQFAYKVTVQSKKAGGVAAVEVAKNSEGGNTYVSGDGKGLETVASAGKGYDFDSGRPLAAAMAAGLEVSLVALLSDPGAGGGSYSTASTLDAPARATAAMRRKAWDSFWSRLFRYMGNTKTLKVTWHDLPDEQLQRILQAWTLTHNTGLFKPEIVQKGFADAMGIADPGEIPEGYLPLNNEKSVKSASASGDAEQGPTAGSGQGQDNGGAGGLGNDHETDPDATDS